MPSGLFLFSSVAGWRSRVYVQLFSRWLCPLPCRKATLSSLDQKDFSGDPLGPAHGNQQQSCTEKRTLGVMTESKEDQSTAGVRGTSPISSTGLCGSCCCCASLSHCKFVSSPLWCWYYSLQGQRVKWVRELSQVWKQSFFTTHYCS